MPRLASEGNVRVWKVPVITDKAAPTVAQITAGKDLTSMIPISGVDINWTQNNATLAMLDESFVISSVGTESAEITLTGVRDDGPGATDDLFWESFERGENFFLVVARFGFSGEDSGPPVVPNNEPAAGDKCEVYPVQSHRPVPLAPAENEFQQAQVSLGITDTPELNAVVA